MKKTALIFVLTFSLGCASLLWASNRIRSAAIVNSTVDSTPIGSTSPSTGAFTSLAANGLTPGNCIQVLSGGVFSSTSNPCPNYGSTTSVCTTANAAFAVCSFSVPLVATQPNTSYKVSCTGVGPSGFPVIQGVSKFTSSVTVFIENGSSLAAIASTYSEMDCVVVGP